MKPLSGIYVRNRQRLLKMPLKTVRSVARKALAECNIKAPLSVVFTDNDYIRKLNRTYTGRDRVTDVLAFHIRDEDDPPEMPLGEVFVNAELAKERAEKKGYSAEAEALLYLVHAILHLAGYDDRTPQQRRVMEQKQTEILKMCGYETND